MPTISVAKDDFFGLIGPQYTLDDMDSLLCYVKGEYKGYNETTKEMRIELNDTNRPDLWCPEGIARQIRFLSGWQDYQQLRDIKNVATDREILVDASLKEVRPYIGAFVARGVAVTEQALIQMIQTQEKICDGFGKKRELVSIGIYNLEAITFPVQYCGVAPHSLKFVPLGTENPMDLEEILDQHPKGLEYARLLKGKPLYPILLDKAGEVLSFPPIINSRQSGEVKVGNKNLFIEVTGKNLRMLIQTLNILAYNFADRGFTIEPVMTRYPYPTEYGQKVIAPYPLQNEMTVNIRNFQKYLGIPYTKDEILRRLTSFGLTIEGTSDPEVLRVATLPYRQDYMHEVDVIEDLAIAIGYNSIDPIMPERFTVGQFTPMTRYEDRVRDFLIGFAFEEVISNILTNKEDFRENVNGMFDHLLEISNVMSESYSVLRNSLIPSLLKVEGRSSKAMYPHRMFEVGETIAPDPKENHGSRTESKLATLIAHAEANFSEMASFLASLQYLMFWDITIKAKDFPLFIAGRSGEIRLGQEVVGFIGEVHPEVLDKWSIKMPAVVMELNLSGLFGHGTL
jgi:phenylalanyl-tRNA synthetase beta chain